MIEPSNGMSTAHSGELAYLPTHGRDGRIALPSPGANTCELGGEFGSAVCRKQAGDGAPPTPDSVRPPVSLSHDGAASPRSEAVARTYPASRHPMLAARAQRRPGKRRSDARSALIAHIASLVADDDQPDGLLQGVVDALHLFLECPYVAITLCDPADPATPTLLAAAGEFEGAMPLCARRSPFPDQDSGPTRRAGEAWRQLSLPIAAGGHTLGFIKLGGGVRAVEHASASLKVVAHHVALAVAHARLFGEAQRARTQVDLLYTGSQHIGAAITVKQAVTAYLECVAARGHHACTVALYQFDAYGRRSDVLVRGRWSPQEGPTLLDQVVPYFSTALDGLLDAGKTVAIADVRRDPRVSPDLYAFLQHGRQPALALIPLRARGQLLGLIILSSPAPGLWDAGDLQPYEAGAIQLATALDRCRQLALLGEHGRHLAVLEDRQRLARDLHDSVTQHLFSLTLIAQTIAPSWQRDSAEGRRRVERVVELGQAALAELRALVTDLHASTGAKRADVPLATFPGIARLPRVGLAAALREYAAAVAQDGPRIDVEPEGYSPQEVCREEALFRVAQEALSNVLKHARAQQVTIRLRTDDDATRLSIADDGIGRGAGTALASGPRLPAGASGGLGVRSMRERAELLGGQFAMRDRHGGGTIVEVTLPRSDV